MTLFELIESERQTTLKSIIRIPALKDYSGRSVFSFQILYGALLKGLLT